LNDESQEKGQEQWGSEALHRGNKKKDVVVLGNGDANGDNHYVTQDVAAEFALRPGVRSKVRANRKLYFLKIHKDTFPQGRSSRRITVYTIKSMW